MNEWKGEHNKANRKPRKVEEKTGLYIMKKNYINFIIWKISKQVNYYNTFYMSQRRLIQISYYISCFLNTLFQKLLWPIPYSNLLRVENYFLVDN